MNIPLAVFFFLPLVRSINLIYIIPEKTTDSQLVLNVLNVLVSGGKKEDSLMSRVYFLFFFVLVYPPHRRQPSENHNK